MKNPTKLMIVAVTLAAVAGAMSYRDRRDHFSCFHCRGFRYVDDKAVLGLHISHQERFQEGSIASSSVPHAHEWWLYSTHITTCASKTFDCRSHQFADGVDLKKEEPNQSPEPTSGLRPAAAHL